MIVNLVEITKEDVVFEWENEAYINDNIVEYVPPI